MQQFVNTFTEDGSHMETLIAVHASPKKNFESDFAVSLAEVKQSDPETWNVDMVFKLMHKSQGWTIAALDTREVAY